MLLPFFVVRQKTAGIVEKFGKFDRIAQAGLHFKIPIIEKVVGTLSLRVQELQVNVETKTKDDVFVRLMIAVQYYVKQDRVTEAYYELSNPVMQIESYVFDEVRSAVPGMTLDDAFQNKDYIANAVKEGLEETMTQYGYTIVRALVNDIDPDAKVKAAMNEINAAQRLRKAAEERGEADRILKVKQAQGDAESKRLQGVGIADQRKAIVEGLRESVEEFRRGVPGSSSNDVMQLVLMTQYFDTLKEMGQNSRSSVVLLPHSPSTLGDLNAQIRDSLISGNLVNAEHDRMEQLTEAEIAKQDREREAENEQHYQQQHEERQDAGTESGGPPRTRPPQ